MNSLSQQRVESAATRWRAAWLADTDEASAEEAGNAPDTTGENESLEDAARDEQEYLRERLRAELDREPTEEEMNEWLRRHTEGY